MSDMMRPLVYGRHEDPHDVLELKEVPVPGPKLRRVLLDVEATTRDGPDRQYDVVFDGPGNKA
jgi:NADPH:quinone reductase-like Zn-dependent oxidoreductase